MSVYIYIYDYDNSYYYFEFETCVLLDPDPENFVSADETLKATFAGDVKTWLEQTWL